MPEANYLGNISWLEFILRSSLALAVGGIVGFERELKSKSAGLRTNMLVSFGAAFFILVPIKIGAVQQNVEILGRVISGIIGGVGFIGGGTILRGEKVKGLTSAAVIWVSAALGIAVGCGLWMAGIFGAIAMWIVLRLFKKFEKQI